MVGCGTLYQVFHRPPHWNVIDILVFRTSSGTSVRHSSCLNRLRHLVISLDYIRRRRVLDGKSVLACCYLLQVLCLSLPKLPCQRVSSSSPRRGLRSGPVSHGKLTDNSIFGSSPDTDRLGMPNWDLQPGPMKEDLEVRLRKKGRMRHLNRPEVAADSQCFRLHNVAHYAERCCRLLKHIDGGFGKRLQQCEG